MFLKLCQPDDHGKAGWFCCTLPQKLYLAFLFFDVEMLLNLKVQRICSGLFLSNSGKQYHYELRLKTAVGGKVWKNNTRHDSSMKWLSIDCFPLTGDVVVTTMDLFCSLASIISQSSLHHRTIRRFFASFMCIFNLVFDYDDVPDADSTKAKGTVLNPKSNIQRKAQLTLVTLPTIIISPNR